MVTTTKSAELANAPALPGLRGWLISLGVVQIILGSVALCIPILASFAAVAVFGAVLLMNAFFQIMHAFKIRSWPRSAWYGLGGAFYAVAGAFVIIYPIGGALSLALTIAVLFIADGTLRISFAIANRSIAGSGWLITAGICSIAVGVLFLVGWPATALWATGLLLGLNLVLIGASHIALAFGAGNDTSIPVAKETQT